MKDKFNEIKYNNNIIYEYYNGALSGKFGVDFCGDEVLFKSLEEAKQFINNELNKGV